MAASAGIWRAIPTSSQSASTPEASPIKRVKTVIDRALKTKPLAISHDLFPELKGKGHCARLAPSGLHDLCERLSQIGDDVVDVFNAHRQSDDIIASASRAALCV